MTVAEAGVSGGAAPIGEDAQNLTSLTCGETHCHIVGVCHLSERSVAEARRAVERWQPVLVCAELCDERAHLLDEAAAHAPPEVLPPLGFSMFADHWEMLLNPMFWVFQLQLMALEALVGTRLGAEQAAAYDAAQAVGAQVYLADREQSITLGRTLAAVVDFTAIRELVRALYGNVSDLAKEVVQLELLLLNNEMSAVEFAQASAMARHIIDRLLNNAEPWGLGRAGEPIQEERDFLLSHSLFHAGCAVPPGSHVVAVLGAAHVPGVVRHFSSFGPAGCGTDNCGVAERVEALGQYSTLPLLGVAGVLLLTSSTGLLCRWALVRRLRRTRGEAWARNVNRASITFAGALGCFGLYRAQRQYGVVRNLQLHRAAVATRDELAISATGA